MCFVEKDIAVSGEALKPFCKKLSDAPREEHSPAEFSRAGKSPECPWVSGTHGMHGLMLCFGRAIHCAHPEVWAVQYLCTQVSVSVTLGGAQPAEGRQTHQCLQEVQLLGL